MYSSSAIKVENLSKGYHIGKSHFHTLQERLVNLIKPKQTADWFLALDDISFSVSQGEIVGIIGPNGAGKTTLLKLISRITFPSRGRIEINGRTSSLLEVGTGFHLELTGRENIYLNGTILGLSRKEIRGRFDEIVDFSGISAFIDTPAKRYSSGMLVRLAFSVAAHLNPEILLLDEVLAVGDADFQRKCLGKMDEVKQSGRTILLVSHNMNHVQQLANRAILIEKGKIKAEGKPSEVVSRYLAKDNTNFRVDLRRRISSGPRSKDFEFTELVLESPINSEILEADEVRFRLKFSTKRSIKDLLLGMSINAGGQNLIECRSGDVADLREIEPSDYEVVVAINPMLRAGIYTINLGAKSREGSLQFLTDVLSFEIKPRIHKELWKSDLSSAFLANSVWKVSELHSNEA